MPAAIPAVPRARRGESSLALPVPSPNTDLGRSISPAGRVEPRPYGLIGDPEQRQRRKAGSQLLRLIFYGSIRGLEHRQCLRGRGLGLGEGLVQRGTPVRQVAGIEADRV